MKRMISILLTAVLLLSMSAAAFADEAAPVTYEGGAENYVFISGSGYTDSDLFQNFKGLLPGDSVEQQITIQNVRSGYYYVKIYMKAVPHVEDAATVDAGKIHDSLSEYDETLNAADKKVPTMEDFLHQLSMTVELDGKEIYNASPDQLDGLSDWVLLGNFYDGDKKTLTVKLNVPLTLGSEYAFRAGEVDWVFKAEEIPYTPSDPQPPKTGDETHILLYAGIMCLSAVAVIGLLVAGKKRKSSKG